MRKSKMERQQRVLQAIENARAQKKAKKLKRARDKLTEGGGP